MNTATATQKQKAKHIITEANMSASLYEISQEYIAGFLALSEMELDETTLTDTLEAMTGDFEGKAVNVAKFFGNLDAEATAIKEAEAKMATRRRSIEAKSARLKDYLKTNMIDTGITKISCPFFQLAIQKAADKVIIASESDIPADFMRIKTIIEPDKIALKEALKFGDVPGAYLEANFTLRIK
jgi:hypothetical protein